MDDPLGSGHARDPSTIHFQFSNHRERERRAEGSTTSSVQGDLASGSGMLMDSASVGEYKGPECYIKPKSKSNLKIIKNAICSVCLAGEVNLSLKQKTLAVSSVIKFPP